MTQQEVLLWIQDTTKRDYNRQIIANLGPLSYEAQRRLRQVGIRTRRLPSAGKLTRPFGNYCDTSQRRKPLQQPSCRYCIGSKEWAKPLSTMSNFVLARDLHTGIQVRPNVPDYMFNPPS
ncbi:MAG: hypothetical protein WAW69_11215 [Polaromonas sp.]